MPPDDLLPPAPTPPVGSPACSTGNIAAVASPRGPETRAVRNAPDDAPDDTRDDAPDDARNDATEDAVDVPAVAVPGEPLGVLDAAPPGPGHHAPAPVPEVDQAHRGHQADRRAGSGDRVPPDPANPGLGRHPEWFAAWWPADHAPSSWWPVLGAVSLGSWAVACVAFAQRWSQWWPTAPAAEGWEIAAVVGLAGALLLRTLRPLYAGPPPAYRLTPEGLELEVLRTPLIAGRWGWTRFRRVVDYDAVQSLQWVAYVPPTQVVCSPGILAEPYWLMRDPGTTLGTTGSTPVEPSRSVRVAGGETVDARRGADQDSGPATEGAPPGVADGRGRDETPEAIGSPWTPPVALALETAEGWVLVAPAEPYRLTQALTRYCPALGGTMPGRGRPPWRRPAPGR